MIKVIIDCIKIFVFLSVLVPFYFILEFAYGWESAILGVVGILALFVGLVFLFVRGGQKIE